MRPLARMLVAVTLSLLLAAPLAAEAGTPAREPVHPWYSYFAEQGATCFVEATDSVGDTATGRYKVVEKTAKRVVLRSGGRRHPSYFRRGGRLQTSAAARSREDGVTTAVRMVQTYPSPGRLAHRRAGDLRVNIRMVLPPRAARVLLTRGRVLTVAAWFRAGGLGKRSVKLADEASTRVTAVGVRTRFKGMRIRYLRPRYVRAFRNELRPVFVELEATEWYARGLGIVRATYIDDYGDEATVRGMGCEEGTPTSGRRGATGDAPLAALAGPGAMARALAPATTVIATRDRNRDR